MKLHTNKVIKDTVFTLTIVLVISILSMFLVFRWDFTENKRYSLSKVSKLAVENNTRPVTVDFYLTEDLPQDVKKLAKEFHSLLKEYQSLSHTDFIINIIHPNSREKEFQATKAGIVPIYREIRERDMEKIQRIFIGAVFHIGSHQETISQLTFDTPLEYEITRLLKQSYDNVKPNIGFVYGHGEANPKQISYFLKELSHLSEISMTTLSKKTLEEEYNVLCIVDPKDNFSSEDIEILEQYLTQGGRLFIALNHANGQLGNRNNGFINRTGIEDMLEKKGLKIRFDFVVDNNCGSITIRQQYNSLNFQNNISFPYIPIITNFSKHTITQGLRSMLLPFASSIQQIKTPTAYVFTPLAQSSAISGLQQAPVFFNLQKGWSATDFNHPHNTIAALLTNEDNNSAIVTITDADFVTDATVTSGPTDNISFAMNSIEWLSDNSGLIQLRNKFTTFSLLEPLNNNTKEMLKYLNFMLPIIAISLIIIIYHRRKQRQRINRSRPGYID